MKYTVQWQTFELPLEHPTQGPCIAVRSMPNCFLALEQINAVNVFTPRQIGRDKNSKILVGLHFFYPRNFKPCENLPLYGIYI
jgi:hypothetical protein